MSRRDANLLGLAGCPCGPLSLRAIRWSVTIRECVIAARCLVVADRLLQAGCEVLMPWGAPIGSGLGLNNIFGLRAMRAHFPDVPLVIDAGLGLPSQAAQAMELGFDAVLLNTAVAKAGDPAAMAEAFATAVRAGQLAQAADPMEPRDMAAPSTPVIGKAFLT